MTPGSSSLISSSSPASVSPLASLKKTSPTPSSRDKMAVKSPKVGSETKAKGKPSSAKFSYSGSGNRSGGKKKTSSAPSKLATAVKETKNPASTSESETEESEVSFEGYSELCERVAKTMYYVKSRPPTTPRPSLPLTILAVDTFSKYARKDTLEFLDIDMAAEIGRNACVSPTALVFALVYLERLSVNNPGYLKTVKPSELFVVSLLVASKFVQDDGEDLGIFNDEWATSANMELKKVNQLELEFLTAIDWHVNIGKEEYDRALQKTEERMALLQGVKRGWFTYTELQCLSNSHLSMDAILPILYEKVVEVVSGICVMYTTFFATLITSSVLAPYLLSVSKLVLVSSLSNSLLTPSSFSSCPDTGSNSSISRSLGSLHVQSPSPGTLPNYVPVSHQHLVTSLEEEENSTELESTMGHLSGGSGSWRQPPVVKVDNVLLHHRRGLETGNANTNFGYSFKCESKYCREGSEDEALQNVQRVLENLLQSSSMDAKMPSNYHLKAAKRHNLESGIHCARSGMLCPV